MEPGETLLEALKREVSEETALDVDVKGLLAVNEWPAVRHRAYYVGLFFKCELVEPGARVVLNDENCEFRWANKMDAHKLDLVDSTRHVIRKYFSNGVDVLPYGEP